MSQYRIHICYDAKGWAYYKRALALQKYAPADFKVTTSIGHESIVRRGDYDLILQLRYNSTPQMKQSLRLRNPGLVLVGSMNIGEDRARRWFAAHGGPENTADHWIFNSRECAEAFPSPDATCISNGVDLDVYRQTSPAESRRPKVIWTGSEFHRKTKRYDEWLVPLAEDLRAAGIQSDFRLVDSHSGHYSRREAVKFPYLSESQIAMWYNTATVYVVGSRSEGTPNPALEAAACGCTIVSTWVGNMPELIQDGTNGYLVDHSYDEFLAAVLKAVAEYPRLSAAMQSVIPSWHWRERSSQYFDLFRRLIDQRRREVDSQEGRSHDLADVSTAAAG